MEQEFYFVNRIGRNWRTLTTNQVTPTYLVFNAHEKPAFQHFPFPFPFSSFTRPLTAHGHCCYKYRFSDLLSQCCMYMQVFVGQRFMAYI